MSRSRTTKNEESKVNDHTITAQPYQLSYWEKTLIRLGTLEPVRWEAVQSFASVAAAAAHSAVASLAGPVGVPAPPQFSGRERGEEEEEGRGGVEGGGKRRREGGKRRRRREGGKGRRRREGEEEEVRKEGEEEEGEEGSKGTSKMCLFQHHAVCLPSLSHPHILTPSLLTDCTSSSSF